MTVPLGARAPDEGGPVFLLHGTFRDGRTEVLRPQDGSTVVFASSAAAEACAAPLRRLAAEHLTAVEVAPVFRDYVTAAVASLRGWDLDDLDDDEAEELALSVVLFEAQCVDLADALAQAAELARRIARGVVIRHP